MKVSMIAAIGKNRELGKDNKLLWHIPEDLKHFRETTKGHPVIMGRKTFESIGYPLPNRTNIVVTRDPSINIPGVIIADSLEKAIDVAKNEELKQLSLRGEEDDEAISRDRHVPIKSGLAMTRYEGEVFIIGGGQIYEQGIKFADKLYLTIVEKMPPEVEELVKTADTFFPDYSEFTKEISEEEKESDGYKYRFVELERI